MSFDNSRITFDPWKDYSGVVMEQGRVQTDADWNEWLAEQSRRIQAGTLDTMGRAVYPATTPSAFEIAPSTSGGSVTIGRGRMYVDGILVENHGDPANASWDPALAEMSGSPQPPSASDANPVAFESQPYFPGAKFPATAGDYLVYLDVWKQPITYIEDPTLVDAAIGVDTTGRLKTVWRVGTIPVAAGTTCASAAPQWPESSGQLTNGTVSSGPSGPCCLTTGSGYTGVENQFYRVEIHNAGSAGGTGATFKWSRENASVQTTITAIATGANSVGNPASKLTVQSLGRDQVLGFSAGNWVEVTNEMNDNLCQPGSLYQIDSVDVASMTITLTTQLPSGFSVTPTPTNTYTRLVRWDQAGKIYKSDKTLWCDLDVVGGGPLANGFYGIPVPTDGSDLVLENGIVVSFGLSSSSGTYLAMDYWSFSARTATGAIDPLQKAPPRGIHHHYAQLSIATVDASGAVTGASDCRVPWGPSGGADGCGCCTCTVGAGGKYSSINAAIKALPANGGEICILPGEYYENVVLSGKKNVVIHGCQWQTHVFSASLQPGASGTAAGGAGTPISQSGLPAVFTIVGCENIELRSLAIAAADGEVGILLDRTPDARNQQNPSLSNTGTNLLVRGKGDVDVILENLILEASTLPAIIAVSVKELKIAENRVYMKDVESLWAAVYLSGEEMCFERNWVGLGTAREFFTPTPPPETPPVNAPRTAANVEAKQVTAPKAASTTIGTVLTGIAFKANLAPGGIHIAGPSKDVLIVENEIIGGTRNGITLGNFILLDSSGADTGKLTGVLWQSEGPCSPGGSGQIPGQTGSGSTTTGIGAGGLIVNLHIDRNRIHQMGMAGIGVVGFWNLRETLEVIRIVNLSITENVIARTMLRRTASFNAKASSFAYGAISLADVENLMIRDNIIADFGYTPGAEVCGIFVLHGQAVEISRNQIKETRDWTLESLPSVAAANGTRAGILMLLVTPPEMTGNAWTNALANQKVDSAFTGSSFAREKPIFEPGIPALRIQENVVRVAIGLALEAFGYGPFSIVNNHFSSGGPVNTSTGRLIAKEFLAPSRNAKSYTDPLLITVLNLGLAIEDVNQGDGFTSAYLNHANAELGVARHLANASSGAVMFTSNTCQLEAWASGVSGFASVNILSYDSVLFTSNQLWVDAPPLTALVDAFLMGATMQMCDNRLQECQYYSVVGSGLSVGVANVTSHNIATYCLKALAPLVYRINTPNVILWPALCPPLKRNQATTGTTTTAKGQ